MAATHKLIFSSHLRINWTLNIKMSPCQQAFLYLFRLYCTKTWPMSAEVSKCSCFSWTKLRLTILICSFQLHKKMYMHLITWFFFFLFHACPTCYHQCCSFGWDSEKLKRGIANTIIKLNGLKKIISDRWTVHKNCISYYTQLFCLWTQEFHPWVHRPVLCYA